MLCLPVSLGSRRCRGARQLHAKPGRAHFEVVPGQVIIPDGKVMCGRKLIPRGSDRVCPIAKGKKRFSIDKVAHVYRPIGQVVLYIVYFIQEAVPVGFRGTREPSLIPGCRGVRQHFISLLPDGCSRIERTVYFMESFCW